MRPEGKKMDKENDLQAFLISENVTFIKTKYINGQDTASLDLSQATPHIVNAEAELLMRTLSALAEGFYPNDPGQADAKYKELVHAVSEAVKNEQENFLPSEGENG